MHYSRSLRFGCWRALLAALGMALMIFAPDLAIAQASPFMTGASSLQTKTFGRSSGSSAVSAAAYRAGERIRDERTGKTYDHSDRRDVMHKEIILPGQFATDDMSWAKDRANLWNAAERVETRSNARVAREYLVALPVELSPAQRIGLVKGFSQELADRYGFAVDCAVHAPRDFPGSDPRNFHAHLLATTREVTTQGLGAKTTLEWNDGSRREIGLGPSIYELLHVRQRWAAATNEVLKEAQVQARIDHRTLLAQGLDREPRVHIPKTAFEMERHGYRSVMAERIREEYEARVEARRQRSAARDEIPAKPQSLEEIRRQARESWLQMRQGHAESAPRDPMERVKDDDLAR
jgi:ATP-dependent exoDNAse (exonuclease V) alpha subunit